MSGKHHAERELSTTALAKEIKTTSQDRRSITCQKNVHIVEGSLEIPRR
jgi:hypothetical protein